MPRKLRRSLGIAAVLFLVTTGYFYFRVRHAAREAIAESSTEKRVVFTEARLEAEPPPGVSLLPARADYHDLALYDGQVYLSGAGGVEAYDREGRRTRVWRTGLELPPAEPGALLVAKLGAGAPELLVATHGAGLLRFDGSGFRSVLPERADLRRVTALAGMAAGRVVFGTETAGAWVYDGARMEAVNPALTTEHVTALAAANGELWIGTLQHGLWRLHAGILEHFETPLPDPQVLTLETHGAVVYAGTPLGVAVFRDGVWTGRITEGAFARAILASDDGVLVGTEDEGILNAGLVNGKRGRHGVQLEEADTEPVMRLVTMGGFRYELSRGALLREEAGQWTRVNTGGEGEGALSDRHVSALGEHDGRLWVGYFDRGLDIVTGAAQSVRHIEDDHLFCVNRIVAGTEQRTAVATANGLVMFSGDQVRQVIRRRDGLIADQVTDVAFARDGMVAATPAGISFLDAVGARSVFAFQGLVNNHVYALGIDGERVLAGTLGGVSVLDHEMVRVNYTTANSGLKRNWITALLRVKDEWWAGTYGGGVVRMDREGVWRLFPRAQTDFVVNPNAMLEARGRVYVGTLDRGLMVYDEGLAQWRSTTVGLPSVNVTALASAGDELYVGTDNGVARFSGVWP